MEFCMSKNLSSMELRDLLERRGIVFPKETKKRDANKIQEIGYYKLKSFAYPFSHYDANHNLLYENLTFKNLLLRYYQDKNLRIFIFHALEDIEVYLNNVIADALGKYGPFGYLEFKNWCDRSISKFKTEKNQFEFKKNLKKKMKRSNLPDLDNLDNKDEDGFPSVWLMTDCLTFGDSVHLFYAMSPSNKRKVAGKFDCTKDELESWLKCLNFVRNQCVHNENLLDLKLTTKPKIPDLYRDSYALKNQKIVNDRIASIVFIIKFLISQVNEKYKFGNIADSLYKIIGNDDNKATALGFKNSNAIECLKRRIPC